MRRRPSVFVLVGLFAVLAGCSVTATKPADSAADQPGATSGSSASTVPGSAVPSNTVPVDGDLLGMADTSDEPMPDTTPRVSGVLDNGLTYVVKRNGRPGKSVSLRLAIKAGSLEELDEHTGVAHFLEHMLFNGTEKYPGNEMTRVLQGFGAAFGPEVNAFTSWDQTVYELTVPHDQASVDEAIQVLREWLTAATIEQDAVEAERGVVLDEWRTRTQTAEGRLRDIAAGEYLAGTPFEGRSPIGTDSDIEGMNADTLRAYYDAWYRPDNAAIIVVGDIDESAMVDKITEEFGDVEARVDEPPKPEEYVFGPMNEPSYALNADPEWTSVDVEVTLPLPAVEGTGRRIVRASLYDQLIYDIMIKRLEREVFAGEAPFDDISHGTNSLVPGLDAPALYAFTDAERVTDTLTALLEEYQRTFQFGFTDAEVIDAKAELTGQLSAAFASDEQQDTDWASEFASAFIDGSTVGLASDFAPVYKSEIEAIDPAALARRFNARWINSAPHVIISAPASQAAAMPDEAEVISIIDTVAGSETTQRDEAAALPDELMAAPAPAEVVETDDLLGGFYPNYSMKELVLANGAHVIVANNDIAPKELNLSAFSPGGLSLVSDDDVVDAQYADELVMSSGVGDLSAPETRQFVSRAGVSLEANIGTTQESFFGSATTDSLDVLLQYLYLSMTEGRADEVVVQQLVKREQPVVDDPSVDADAAEGIAENEARYGDEPRYRETPTPEAFATLDIEGVERTWSQRMGSASDWTFVLTGDLPDDVEDLVAAYLGNLPSDGSTETATDVSRPMPTGVGVVDVNAGTGETGSVVLRFSTPIDAVTPELQDRADLANAVIDSRLIDVIREQFGDSYSPTSYIWMTMDPDPSMEAAIYVTGAPDRLDAIHDEVVDVLGELAVGVDDATFSAAAQPIYEDRKYLSNYQFATAAQWYRRQPGYDVKAAIFDGDTVTTFDAADVSSDIAAFLPVDQHIAVITRPLG